MTTAEVLRIALSREEDAIKLYSKLSNQHSEIRDLLMQLVTEEQKHKKLIEKKMAELKKY